MEKDETIKTLTGHVRLSAENVADASWPTGEEPNIPQIPAALTRRFEVRLLPRTQAKAVSLREVRDAASDCFDRGDRGGVHLRVHLNKIMPK